MPLEQLLENIKWNILKEEGITKEDVDLVILDIAFTPVIPCKGDDPFDVIETTGGKYLISNHPIFNQPISADELKVMRYRYLTSK